MGRNTVSQKLVHELTSVPGFTGCSKKQLALVDRLTYRVTVPAGNVVIRERSFGTEAFVIVSGTAAVTRQDRLVTTLGPGDYFGELAAIDTARRNATLTALSELTLLVISPREFATLVADIPGFRSVLLRNMTKKLRAADETIETMRIVFHDSPMTDALSNAPMRTAS
jgi:CRP/FNR family transcriptional regulator, cyclic AMP receptor protein